MANSLYRCRAEAYLKPQAWDHAIRIPENEIESISMKISVPNPGQATSYRTGYALYEHNSSCSIRIRDKFLLKCGWVGLESAQRLVALPEPEFAEEYRVPIEDLVTGFENNKGLVEYFRESVASTIVIDLYYPYGNVEKYLLQRYFFRIRSANANLGNSEYSSITIEGKDLYRSVLSQSRVNFAVKAGTPHEVVAGRIMGQLGTAQTRMDGQGDPELVKVIPDNPATTKLERDLRVNGQTAAAALANVEAKYNVKFASDPREPMSVRMISDAPNRRSVFFLGIGLFEGYKVKTQWDVQGANNIRATADRLNNNSDVVDTTAVANDEGDGEGNADADSANTTGVAGTSGANTNTYRVKTVETVRLKLPDQRTAFLSTQGAEDRKVTYNIPGTGRVVNYDLSKWFESRPGLKTEKWLSETGAIRIVQSAHAAFDSDLLDRTRDIVSLFGGTVLAREDNDAKGSGVITIKSDGYLEIDGKEYQIYEYYAHAIDHAALNAQVDAGEKIATASNKSPNSSNQLKHIHGSFYVNYFGSRLYVNPVAVGKFGFRRKDKKRNTTISGALQSRQEQDASNFERGVDIIKNRIQGFFGNGVYTESDALTRMVLAEARNTGKLGMALVARVILNRSCVVSKGEDVFQSNGKSDLYNIIAAPNQFEPTWSVDNNWKDAYKNSTENSIKTAKEAISLAQNPSKLREELISVGKVSETTADNLILSTFFAAAPKYIRDSVKEVITFKQPGFAKHLFGVAKNISNPKSKLLCEKHSIDTSNVGESTNTNSNSPETDSEGDTGDETSTGGTTGASNTTAENTIGAGGGFVGIPELITEFQGCPKALQIQPGFTFLVFDTRKFNAWAQSGGRSNQGFQVPIPDEYKDWSIVAMELEWKSDLRVKLRALRPLFGQNPAFKYTGADFKDVPEYEGNYYKYIRSFNNLCFRVTEGENKDKNSCTLETTINSVYNIVGKKREEPSNVSTLGGTDDANGNGTVEINLTDGRSIWDDATSRGESGSRARAGGHVSRIFSASGNNPADSSWTLPASGVVTSPFGPREGRNHNGLDIGNVTGTPILSVADGIVISAGSNTGGEFGGTGVIIDHGEGVQTRYYHLSAVDVKSGDKVKGNQKIGEMGNTGRSTGPHLHFEVYLTVRENALRDGKRELKIVTYHLDTGQVFSSDVDKKGTVVGTDPDRPFRFCSKPNNEIVFKIYDPAKTTCRELGAAKAN